ncbi:MAG: alpha-ketoglutarate transporter [Mycobacterium sp.]|nr:alpha-ketoglutarate transporter [Mycobacterium sp.]
MQTEQRIPDQAPLARSVAGNVIRGSLGNLIEWYDWYVYAAFSIYFASVFFPSSNSTAQLLNTAGIFAVGFLIRPLGGWLLGWYADRAGRRAALTLSVTMMGVGSLGIAVLPGYAQIGALAPILLVAARLLQGLSLGGEYGTSATYLSEVATPHRRGFYSSFQYVTLTSGQLLALGVQIVLQQILTPEQMHDWGWRIAFAIGAVAAVTVMRLRRTMDESQNYKLAVEANSERGSLRILLSYPRECLTVVGLTLGGTIAFYTFTTYMQKFMINTTGLPKEQVTWINFVALVIFVGLQPLVGAFSDKIGRRPVLIAFGIGATSCTVPLLTAVSHAGSALSAFGLMLMGLVIVSGYTSINAVLADVAERDRATGPAETAPVAALPRHRRRCGPDGAVARVYENYLQVIVRDSASIRRVDDLRGLRVSIGPAGSGAAATSEVLFEAAGLGGQVDMRRYRLHDGVARLADGGIEALVWSGGVPTPAISELDATVPVRMLDIGELAVPMTDISGYPYLTRGVPAGEYAPPGLRSIGVPNLLLCRPDIADDVIAAVVDVLATDAPQLVPPSVRGLQYLDPPSMIQTGLVPLHPGAIRQYRKLHG